MTGYLKNDFKSVSSRVADESKQREGISKKIMSFGIDFLDHATRGILPDDLVILGARSGAGKTQFCVNLALINSLMGKKVHMIALEASTLEIERRMKYLILAELFYSDKDRVKTDTAMNFINWYLGDHENTLAKYEDQARQRTGFLENFFTFYKTDKFGIKELIESVESVFDETDLIIIDHVHYFDFDDDNENKALREITKTVRKICQVIQRPIILVAHLRKRDKNNTEVAPGLDEFHGSSELTKIATKVISIGVGNMITPGLFETYVRIPKCRIDGSVTRYAGKVIFNGRTNRYDSNYELGTISNSGSYDVVSPEKTPPWARVKM